MKIFKKLFSKEKRKMNEFEFDINEDKEPSNLLEMYEEFLELLERMPQEMYKKFPELKEIKSHVQQACDEEYYGY